MKITNTSTQPPIVHLFEEMFEKNSIERSEARGAEELLKSESLPVRTGFEGDASFLALGFTFGEPHADDPIFRPATLPTGWSRAAGEGSYWTHIVDERGFQRVAIFYKAAFYDRSAHMNVSDVGRGVASAATHGNIRGETKEIPWEQLTPDEARKARSALVEYASAEPTEWREKSIANAKAALASAPPEMK